VSPTAVIYSATVTDVSSGVRRFPQTKPPVHLRIL